MEVNLIWFLKQEYNFKYVLQAVEVISNHREVTIR
jgi:hypothetical protein